MPEAQRRMHLIISFARLPKSFLLYHFLIFMLLGCLTANECFELVCSGSQRGNNQNRLAHNQKRSKRYIFSFTSSFLLLLLSESEKAKRTFETGEGVRKNVTDAGSQLTFQMFRLNINGNLGNLWKMLKIWESYGNFWKLGIFWKITNYNLE